MRVAEADARRSDHACGATWRKIIRRSSYVHALFTFNFMAHLCGKFISEDLIPFDPRRPASAASLPDAALSGLPVCVKRAVGVVGGTNSLSQPLHLARAKDARRPLYQPLDGKRSATTGKTTTEPTASSVTAVVTLHLELYSPSDDSTTQLDSHASKQWYRALCEARVLLVFSHVSYTESVLSKWKTWE